jgi:hypothetical protein
MHETEKACALKIDRKDVETWIGRQLLAHLPVARPTNSSTRGIMFGRLFMGKIPTAWGRR